MHVVYKLNNKLVWITGAYGFIGKSLVAYLRKNHPDMQLELFNRYNHPETLRQLPTPDVIVHLASSHSTADNDCYINNLQVTQLFLEFASANTHVIFTSSATVYSDDVLQTGAYEDSETKPKSIYGLSKLHCEQFIQHKTNNYSIFRLVAQVGRNPTHGLLPDIIRKLLDAEKNKQSNIELLGKWPGSVKPFCYVDDTCRILSHEIDTGVNTGNVYNITAADSISVATVAQHVMDTLNIHKNIIWNNSKTWAGDNQLVVVKNLSKRWYPNKCFYSREAIITATKDIIKDLV